LKISNFPIGSPESRAAARAELDRRRHGPMQEVTVVMLIGLPGTNAVRGSQGGKRNTERGTIECYKVSDGSVALVISIDWDGNGKRVTRFLRQVWSDRRDYDGTLSVPSIEKARRLPYASEYQPCGIWGARGVQVPASWGLSPAPAVFVKHVRLGADGEFHDASNEQETAS
jgi:hypothetical protein